jgi:predicted DNA-binding transcriptional regulator AlpA
MSQHSCGLGHDGGVEVTRAGIGDRLLDDYAVAKITGRARSTLQKDRVAGTGIPWVRLGRLVRYRQSDVTAYLAALPSRRSTSEPEPQRECV